MSLPLRRGARERALHLELGTAALRALEALHDLLVAELERLAPLLLAALHKLEAELGSESLDAVLDAFAEEFGVPLGSPDPDPARSRLPRALALLAVHLLNRNPALRDLRDAFAVQAGNVHDDQARGGMLRRKSDGFIFGAGRVGGAAINPQVNVDAVGLVAKF